MAQSTLAKIVTGQEVNDNDLLETADAVNSTVRHAEKANFDDDGDGRELGTILAFRLLLHKKLLPYRQKWDAIASVDDPHLTGKPSDFSFDGVGTSSTTSNTVDNEPSF